MSIPHDQAPRKLAINVCSMIVFGLIFFFAAQSVKDVTHHTAAKDILGACGFGGTIGCFFGASLNLFLAEQEKQKKMTKAAMICLSVVLAAVVIALVVTPEF